MLPDFRSARRLTLFLAASWLAVGCAQAPVASEEPQAEVPVDGGEFRIAQIAPSSLDPALVYDSYDAALVNQLYDGLLEHDANFTVQPNVARSWRISEDGRTYRFLIEPNVVFHDGSHVTARDVAFTLERIFRLDPETTTLARQYLSVIAGSSEYARGETRNIEGIEVIHDQEIEIRLSEPYAAFLNVLASEVARIVPRDYVLAHGDDVLQRAPVGCGPFRLVRWDAESQLVLERFDRYHGQKSYLDRLVILTPPAPVLPHALAGFAAGTLHAVELTAGGRDALEAVQGAQIHRRRELSLTLLGFNSAVAPLDDARLRRALAHAIDVDDMATLTSPGRAPATGVLPPGFPGFTPEPKRLPYDPDRALRLLEEAGHPGAEGLPVLVIAIPRRTQNDESLARDLCDQLARVGVRARAEYFDWEDFDRGLRESSFAAFLITWVADLPDPDSFFYPLLHTNGSVNYFGYGNATVDAALDAARSENDRGHRIELYRDIERTVLAQAVLVPVHFSSTLFAVQPNVRDFAISSMGGSDLPLHRVWFRSPSEAAGVAR